MNTRRPATPSSLPGAPGRGGVVCRLNVQPNAALRYRPSAAKLAVLDE